MRILESTQSDLSKYRELNGVCKGLTKYDSAALLLICVTGQFGPERRIENEPALSYPTVELLGIFGDDRFGDVIRHVGVVIELHT
jgi:hypothetical protein